MNIKHYIAPCGASAWTEYPTYEAASLAAQDAANESGQCCLLRHGEFRPSLIMPTHYHGAGGLPHNPPYDLSQVCQYDGSPVGGINTGHRGLLRRGDNMGRGY